MSDDKLIPVNTTPALSTKEQEQEEMYTRYLNGVPLKEIAQQYDKSYRTVLRYSKELAWSKRRDADIAEISDASAKGRDVLIEETVDRAVRVMNKVITDMEVALYNEDPDSMKMNIKMMVDSIDKLTRLKMHMETGGVDKKEIHLRSESIDWTKIVQESVKATREHGEAFDVKDFARKVVKGGDV